MPEYYYTCADGHIMRVRKKMKDPHPELCQKIIRSDGAAKLCGKKLSRVYNFLPFHMK